MNPLFVNIIICISIILFSKIIPLDRNAKEKFMLYATFVSLVFFHTFIDIYSIPDLEPYYLEFLQVEHNTWTEILSGETSRLEIGFLVLLKLVNSIGGDFRIVLLICSLLIITPYYIAIRKYSPYAALSVILILLTTYNQSLFVLRQHIAIAITIYSYQFVINRNFRKFAIAMVLAFLFHKSSIVFIPIYFIYGIKNNKSYIITIIASTVVLSLITRVLYSSIGFEMGYNTYIEDNENTTNNLQSILYLLILIAYIFFINNSSLKPGINKLSLTLLIFTTILCSVGIGLSMISRLSLYYNAILFISTPLTSRYINDNIIKFAYVICIIAVFTYMTFYGSFYNFIEGYNLDFNPIR